MLLFTTFFLLVSNHAMAFQPCRHVFKNPSLMKFQDAVKYFDFEANNDKALQPELQKKLSIAKTGPMPKHIRKLTEMEKELLYIKAELEEYKRTHPKTEEQQAYIESEKKKFKYDLENERGRAIWSRRSEAQIAEDVRSERWLQDAKIPPLVRHHILRRALFKLPPHVSALVQHKEDQATTAFEIWSKNIQDRLNISPFQFAKIVTADMWMEEEPAFRVYLDMDMRFEDHVLDEKTNALTPEVKDNPSKIVVHNSSFKSRAHAHAQSLLQLSSVKHWHKSYQEYLQVRNKKQERSLRHDDDGSTDENEQFVIDDTALFVPNNCPADYFVVL